MVPSGVNSNYDYGLEMRSANHPLVFGMIFEDRILFSCHMMIQLSI